MPISETIIFKSFIFVFRLTLLGLVGYAWEYPNKGLLRDEQLTVGFWPQVASQQRLLRSSAVPLRTASSILACLWGFAARRCKLAYLFDYLKRFLVVSKQMLLRATSSVALGASSWHGLQVGLYQSIIALLGNCFRMLSRDNLWTAVLFQKQVLRWGLETKLRVDESVGIRINFVHFHRECEAATLSYAFGIHKNLTSILVDNLLADL